MKKLYLVALLAGLIYLPLSQAKTPRQPAKPVCAQGQLITLFNETGDVVTSDYHYYRCLLKQDQSGYLVQDFYWPSAKKQMDPLLIAKEGLNEWDIDAAGATGLLVNWYENGQKKHQSNYVGGKMTGLATGWYENGQKRLEGQSTAGESTGLWTFWYENGQKSAEGAFANDQQTGNWISWYSNGQKASEGQYQDGKETGLWTFWFESGRKMGEEQFKDGKAISRKAWTEDGQEIKLIN